MTPLPEAAAGASGPRAPSPVNPGRSRRPPPALAPQLPPEERVFQALTEAVQQYSTGGALTDQEQQRTVDLCLRLLGHLQS